MFAFLGGSVGIKIRNHYQEFRSWQLSSFLLAISIKNNNNQKKQTTTPATAKIRELSVSHLATSTTCLTNQERVKKVQ